MLDLFVRLCLLHSVVCALPPRASPPSPLSGVSITALASLPTPPPSHHDLLRRDVSSNLCGWVDGKSNLPVSCDTASATCLWNPEMKLVGCGNSQLFPSATECVDYTASSSGSLNPSIQTCSATAPYCGTAHFPNSYTMFPCGSIKNQQVTVSITYAGAQTPILLPRTLGIDGSITVETQLPTSSVISPSTTVSVSGTASITETCTASTSSPSLTCEPINDGDNRASLIAAAVGGVVLLLGLPFGIKMVWRKYSWRKTESPPKQRTYPFGRQQAIPVEGPNFLFSQEWHGKQYEQTKRSPPPKPYSKGPYMNT